MPILISHRGNTEGPTPGLENKPEYIMGVLANYPSVHCEIDVWLENGQYFLGHDGPKYRINPAFVDNNRLWCHAKNINALEAMLRRPNAHCFWHQEDDFTITSLGYIWTYPGKFLTSKSIAVMPEYTPEWDISPAVGVCTDFISELELD